MYTAHENERKRKTPRLLTIAEAKHQLMIESHDEIEMDAPHAIHSQFY